MKRRVIRVKSEENNKIIITIMKNDKKNRRNKISMTQDYDYNQTDYMNDNNGRNDNNDDEINRYG